MALASLAASTLVSEMTTTGWQKAREAVGELWHRLHPDRADTVVAELDETRAEVLQARCDGDQRAEQELLGEWQRRLRRLLASSPGAVTELQRLIDELRPPGREGQPQSGNITLTAEASGRSRITMAGRDINVGKG
ncbi:hypothetical protein ACWDQL_32920 [Streptomyces olivaceus]